MREQGHQRKQPQQGWRRAQDGQVRPLPLRFDAQVGAGLLEGHLHLPMLDEPFHDLGWRYAVRPRRLIRSAQSSRASTRLCQLRERWQAGVQNSRQLWREVQARGFPGGKEAVRRLVVRWLLVRPEAELQPDQQVYLQLLSKDCPEVVWSSPKT